MSVTAVPLQPVKRRYIVWLWIGLALALIGSVAVAWKGTASVVAAKGTNEQFLAWNASQPGVVTTASGLQYRVLREGEGAHPTDADVALFKYVGRLRDGTVFDSNDQGVPAPIKGGTVDGFAEGLKLMNKGAKFRFWIKPELGYKDQERPDPRTGKVLIPANSLLVFDVELLDFIPETVLRQQMQMQQMMRQGGGAGAAMPPAGEP